MENRISDYVKIIEMAQDHLLHLELGNKNGGEDIASNNRGVTDKQVVADNRVASEKRYGDIKFLSTYIEVPVPTLRDWIRDEKIPCHRKGRLIRFDLNEIDEWMKQK